QAYLPEYMELAINKIIETINMVEGYQFENKFLQIDLAECHHLLTVMLIKKEQLDEAENHLTQALELENNFCNETKANHFLKFTTLQSLGDVKRRLKKFDEADK